MGTPFAAAFDRAARVNALSSVVDSQRRVQEPRQRTSQVRISDFVAGFPALRLRHNDSAVPQAREMIRYVGPREAQLPTDDRRITRPGEQHQQDS